MAKFTITEKPRCFAYWAECPNAYPRGKDCELAKKCYAEWFKLGGILGLEGIMKDGNKRYDIS